MKSFSSNGHFLRNRWWWHFQFWNTYTWTKLTGRTQHSKGGSRHRDLGKIIPLQMIPGLEKGDGLFFSTLLTIMLWPRGQYSLKRWQWWWRWRRPGWRIPHSNGWRQAASAHARPADPFLSLGLLHQLVRGHRLVRLVRACVHVSMAAACLESSAWDGG